MKHKICFLKLLLRISELLFKGNYVDRWKEAKRIWPEYFESINMKGLKTMSNKNKSISKGTIEIEVRNKFHSNSEYDE